jgi:hypothetical protein
MPEITNEIVKKIGVLKTQHSGWNKELNLVSWNEAKAKYDIRDWSPDHKACGKGITLDEEEAQLLLQFLQEELEQ